MKIEVHFQRKPWDHGVDEERWHVATINVPPEMMGTVEAILAWAFAITQNREGSWSRGVKLVTPDGVKHDNPDWNWNLIWVAPLAIIEGREVGWRSSVTGDLFVVIGDDGARRVWLAKGQGFERVA